MLGFNVCFTSFIFSGVVVQRQKPSLQLQVRQCWPRVARNSSLRSTTTTSTKSLHETRPPRALWVTVLATNTFFTHRIQLNEDLKPSPHRRLVRPTSASLCHSVWHFIFDPCQMSGFGYDHWLSIGVNGVAIAHCLHSNFRAVSRLLSLLLLLLPLCFHCSLCAARLNVDLR